VELFDYLPKPRHRAAATFSVLQTECLQTGCVEQDIGYRWKPFPEISCGSCWDRSEDMESDLKAGQCGPVSSRDRSDYRRYPSSSSGDRKPHSSRGRGRVCDISGTEVSTSTAAIGVHQYQKRKREKEAERERERKLEDPRYSRSRSRSRSASSVNIMPPMSLSDLVSK